MRIEGQDTREEEQKRNLREELEERERRHFSSKEDRDCRKGNHLLLEGSRSDTEDRIVPRSVDADGSDVEVKSDDERWILLVDTGFFWFHYLLLDFITFWSVKAQNAIEY